MLVRLRFSDVNPGQVTGYSVGLAGHDAGDGTALWYGGGRLAAELTLPRLRRRWDPQPGGAAERSGAFRFTAPERDAIFDHAARQAAAATEHIRRSVRDDPAGAADAAWAAADTLHVAARALRQPGTAPCGRQLRSCGPRSLRRRARPQPARETSCGTPRG